MCGTCSARDARRQPNIVLIGFMGSGKTSVGRELSRRLGRELIDTDELVEAQAGCSISDIFARHGEAAFREMEAEAIRKAADSCGTVISVGGGAILRAANVQALRETGVLVHLDATAEAIHERVASETHRPLLRVDDPVAAIRQLLDGRRAYYALADVIIETTGRTVESVVDELLSRYGCT